jgi:hypothetical protein
MTCVQTIDAALLADYWLALLPKPEEDDVEEHLFNCDECGTRLREVIALAEGIRTLAREGSLQMIVTDTFLQQAAKDGLRVREYAPPAGGSVHCTVTAEDDLLVGRLAANLSGAKQIDLCLCDEQGVEQQRLPDIPFQSAAGSIAWQPSMTWAKAVPTNTLIARLVTVDETGAEGVLGEYTFHHTRTLPGPPP